MTSFPPTHAAPASRSNGGRRRLGRALTAAALALVAVGPWELASAPEADAKEPAKAGAKGSAKGAAKAATKPTPKAVFEYGCRVQSPQPFLERRSFIKKRIMDPTKHALAVRWFAERYGHAEDETTMRWNSQSARERTTTVQFMGLPLMIHSKIAPALACVEKRLRQTCAGKSGYTPRAVGGLREANTYRGTEISNHLFGIAIDIDPDRNPCCGCVEPWPSSPLCKVKANSVYERTAIPKCWIKSFERFGFDWLGHDDLQDTMHFEFLGDPDRITK